MILFSGEDTPRTVSLPDEVFLGEVSRLLHEGKSVTIRPKGTSMNPFIIGGWDCVELKRLPTVKVGDMVLCRLRSGRYVLHRVVGIEGNSLTLMGDGNLVQKERCTLDDVEGTVQAIIKGGNGKRVTPGKGRLWRALLPERRYLLFIWRRLPWIRKHL